MIQIRDEIASDVAAREHLLDACFGPGRFLKTSQRLREGRRPARGLALSAVRDETLVGTVRLWDVETGCGRPALLLGPLAVAPEVQGQGFGQALVTEAVAAARSSGIGVIILVGDMPYYGRFGFTPAPRGQFQFPGPVNPARILALEATPGAMAASSGLVRGL